MKSVIIDRLIKIEENAREITKEADLLEQELPAAIHRETEQLEKNLRADYEKKASELSVKKQNESERKIKELELEYAQKSKRLEQLFSQNKKLWEEEIFNAVLGGFSWR